MVTDPLVGRTIGDRYEITSLIKAGGMGAVYRATQRALDREVAVKFIRPHLVAPESVQRFMTEARAASRLNHPHVVSVFDFGRTSDGSEDLLFLVMELLTGLDLGEVMNRIGFLPLPRVVNIVSQVLEALSEAHHAGIIHRDVKPENVILAHTRAGGDHVKVIDFGVARMLRTARITEAGVACGTPEYIAPEQAMGESPGPAADIYSVGVMLFELLTGRLPFDKGTPAATLFAHATAARPDPRNVAPRREIPDRLALACLRALEINPERRFASALAFLDAIEEPARSSDRPVTLEWVATPPRQQRRASTLPAGFGDVPTAEMVNEDRPAASPCGRAPLVGREEDMDWVLGEIGRGRRWIALTGRPGVGKSRLLSEVMNRCRDLGMVLSFQPEPRPFDEIGYRGLVNVARTLTSLTTSDLEDPKCEDWDRWAYEALRTTFRWNALRRPTTHGRRSISPETTKKAASSSFAWAVRRGQARAKDRRLYLFIDDVDRLDRASLNAILEQQREEPIEGFTIVTASEEVPIEGEGIDLASRALSGLSRAHAVRMMMGAHRASPALDRDDEDIEPLYLEQMLLARSQDGQGCPRTLADLLEWRVQGLAAGPRRVLQAVAVTGVTRVESLHSLLRHTSVRGSQQRVTTPAELEAMLVPLADSGLVAVSNGEIRAAHEMFARTAVALAPGGAIAEIHAAAAEATPKTHDWIELRAYHAILGLGDFEAFLAIEDAARLRAQRGDDKGAIAALWQAVSAARTSILRGEGDTATAALGVFGRKLATALINDGHLDEAQGILEEVLDVSEPEDAGRALVLEQLGALAQLRGKNEEAKRCRRTALDIARRSGDANLAERLRAFLVEGGGDRDHERESPVPSSAGEGPRPVLVVEDDRSIREGLQSVVESDGRQAYGAANGKEALELLKQIPRPGLILLDLMMPVMTGWELLAQLRSDTALAGIPVVVVSAVAKREEPGATRVIQKPVQVSTLLSLVEEFCG